MKKRRENKKKRKIKYGIILVPICILSALISYILSTAIFFKTKVETSISATGSFSTPHYSASMIMVGDALIHGAVYYDARQADGSYNFKQMIDDTKPIIQKYDIAYYNQETVLGGTELGLSTYPCFNSPYEVGDAFIDAGFNLVSLATNHTMDRGETAVLNSVAYWNNHPEVVTSGQWSSFEEREKATKKIHEINGIKYAFFSYTMWTNGLETPYGKEYLNNVYSPEQAKADIEAVKDKADVIMVAMHWGNEYHYDVSSIQQEVAQYLSDLGVNIIIGAHPHVVEPITYINDTLVIYSLGNFISAQIGNERLTGIMVTTKIHKTIEDGKVKIKVDVPHAELTYTKYSASRFDFNVYPYSMLNDSIFPGYQQMKSEIEGVATNMDNRIKFMNLKDEDDYATK